MFTWLKIFKLLLIKWIIIIDFTSFSVIIIEKKNSSFSFHWSSTRPAPQISCQAFSPAISDLLQSLSHTEGV